MTPARLTPIKKLLTVKMTGRIVQTTKHHLAVAVALPRMLRSEPLPCGVSSEDRHRRYADVAAPKTPSQRPGWLMALTWDMVCYFADKRPTMRILHEGILAQEEEHANDMHDLLVGHEGHPMLKK
jgi:hypothetical protein